MGQTETAIASATLGVEKCDTDFHAERFHCHLVLATAHLISREIESGEKHVASLLDLLPQIEDFPPAANFHFSLRDMAMIIGRDRILELIQRSPSAAILAPLVDTLKPEGPERFREVEEHQGNGRGLGDGFRIVRQLASSRGLHNPPPFDRCAGLGRRRRRLRCAAGLIAGHPKAPAMVQFGQAASRPVDRHAWHRPGSRTPSVFPGRAESNERELSPAVRQRRRDAAWRVSHSVLRRLAARSNAGALRRVDS